MVAAREVTLQELLGGSYQYTVPLYQRGLLHGPDGVLLEDVLFPSPSGAAGFVTGSSINGMEAWTTHGGVMLKDLETRNAANAEGGTD